MSGERRVTSNTPPPPGVLRKSAEVIERIEDDGKTSRKRREQEQRSEPRVKGRGTGETDSRRTVEEGRRNWGLWVRMAG